MILNTDFKEVEQQIYKKCNFIYTPPIQEEYVEGIEYGAGSFELNDLKIKTRSSKITPKKVGQFVTLWKRNKLNVTEPYNIIDPVDLVIVNTRTNEHFGQFIFPIRDLERHGIISSTNSKGKRGFRVYPPWDKAVNTQAIKSQKWQCEFFLEIDTASDLTRAKQLYQIKH